MHQVYRLGAHEKHGARGAAAGPVTGLPALSGDFRTCEQIFPGNETPKALAVEAKWLPVPMCFNKFAVLYSAKSKTPLVVVEKLNKAQVSGAQGEERTDNFFPDPRLGAGRRAEIDDYAGSGFDRGHMAPAGDQPDHEAMMQSFALANMVPQDPTNNRKIWSKVEGDVRKFVKRSSGDVFVFSGPLFDGGAKTIGPNRVWVPSRLFKLVYDEASGRSWAYILPNTAEARVQAPVDYAEFVKQTGWRVLPLSSVASLSR